MSDWIKCNGLPAMAMMYDRIDVGYLREHPHSATALNIMPKIVHAHEDVRWWRPSPTATDAAHPAAESPREVSDVQPDDARTSPASEHSDAPPGVQETLNARGARYGDFTDNARISQRIKDAIFYEEDRAANLSHVQREALEMIAQKIARILNGDPNYRDNWHDIQGYARLAEERCKE